MEQFHHLVQRVEELESISPDPTRGAGVGLQPKMVKPVIDAAKAITSLSPLTDVKSAFRQWDTKMVNALARMRPGYGFAIERMKNIIYQGEDP